MRITLLCLVFVAACTSSGRSLVDAGVPDDGAVDGAPSGAVCGGFAHILCSATEFCDYPDNSCGVGDQTGHCKARPIACPLIAGKPTCACDGRVYAGDCPAYTGGVDLNAHGTCDLLPGKFACGYTQCDLATEYCRREPHAATADAFSCIQLPPSTCTGTPACTCLASERCGSACAGDARVGLTLTCPPTG